MVMAAPPPQVIVPFSYGSRLRREKLEVTKDFALDGAEVTFELDPVGYLYGILVHIFGTWTVTTAALVFREQGIFNYLRRAVLDTPGQANPTDASGDTVHLDNLLNRYIVPIGDVGIGFDPANPSGLDTNTWADANLKQIFANAVAANPLHLWYFIPGVRNARDLRGMRAIGHGGQRTFLKLTPSTEADLVTTAANSDASAVDVEVFQYYYDGIPPGVAPPPVGWATTLEETRQLIAAVGDQVVAVDPEGIALQVFSRIVLNNAPASGADITAVSLNLDRRKLIDTEEFNSFAFYFQHAKRTQLPSGVVAFDRDMFAADPEPIDPSLGNTPRGRDWIFTDELVKFFPTYTIAAGATLGTVANIVTGIKRLVPIGA